MSIDRSSKLAVLCWACGALALQTWLVAGWPEVRMLTAGAFAAGALMALVDARWVAVVLSLTYVFPALTWFAVGRYDVAYDVVWMGALLGVIMPQALRTPWQLPGRWRVPLLWWALVIAAGAVVVACREVDFNPRLLTDSRMPSEMWGGVPRFTVRWILHAALSLVLGILWFDWLFGARLDVRRSLMAPLAASAAVMVAVALYQLFVDVRFLNRTVYGGLGRATGTMFDGNVMGTLAALWIGGFVLYARELESWRRLALGVGVTAAWLAVWASASRTGFGAAVVVTAFVLFEMGRSRPTPRSGRDWRRLMLPGLLVGLATLAVVLGPATGTIARFRGTLSAPGAEPNLLVELWNRNGYGQRSVEMLSDYPLFGVGVGSFHLLVNDYARLHGGPVVSDNAQNWYRHQLVEFGMVGSGGWILWVFLFGWFVLRRRGPDAPGRGEGIVRGMLIAFALVSLVGMPGQVLSVVVTFWTMAFWFVRLAGDPPLPIPLRARAWVPIAVACLVYTAGTISLASTDLRVPARAQRVGRPYSYGFYAPEPDGTGGEQRWARQRAAILLDAPAPWLLLTLGAHHADIGRQPVDVDVWLDGKLILEETLHSPQPTTHRIGISGDRGQVLLETRVSRVWRPREFGVADDRELGLLVKWGFSDQPGAPTVSGQASPEPGKSRTGG